jgi:hypothetical protein
VTAAEEQYFKQWSVPAQWVENSPPPGTLYDAEYFEDSIDRVLDEVRQLILQRHKKYGPKNIADTPGGALSGIVVRLHDKLARLANGVENFDDETVEQTVDDIIGYGVIAQLVLRRQWPGLR